jgi:CheY-like chemotaxis protein
MPSVVTQMDCQRMPELTTEAEVQHFQPTQGIDDVVKRVILVADDNRDSANTLCTLLRALGHDAYAAYDGIQAIEQAAKLDPDVVLLDIGMPNVDGYAAARAIRQQKLVKRPVLIAVTGWGHEEDRQRTRQAGFDHHFVKPVDPDGIFELLN